MKAKFLLSAFALAIAARAEPTNANVIAADAERAIERAYLRASETSLAEAAKPLEAALATDPKNPALLYTRAFAYYAATAPLRATKGNNGAIEAEFNRAIALLDRVKGQPWEAEAAALHSSILGQLIGLKGGMSGMMLGPKSNQLIARAEKALPGNPRVLLFRGISLLNTPPMFGGDSVKGAKLLRQAADIFAKAGASAPGPHWGRADALTWLGLAEKNSGDLGAARSAWEQALALEPDYGWVKFALLPSLDQTPAK